MKLRRMLQMLTKTGIFAAFSPMDIWHYFNILLEKFSAWKSTNIEKNIQINEWTAKILT